MPGETVVRVSILLESEENRIRESLWFMRRPSPALTDSRGRGHNCHFSNSPSEDHSDEWKLLLECKPRDDQPCDVERQRDIAHPVHAFKGKNNLDFNICQRSLVP